MDPNKKTVLLLSLEDYSWLDPMYKTFLTELESKCNLIRISDAYQALCLLGKERCAVSAVLVYEPSLMKSSNRAFPEKSLAEVLEAFTLRGGTTVFACNCSSFVTSSDLSSFFQNFWHLPWQRGNYVRTTLQLNHSSRLKLEGKIAAKVSMKAVSLKQVATEDLIYRTDNDSTVESMVFGPSRVEMIEEGPVIFAQHGQGRLGWVGDVNNEQETGPILFAMCGLET